MAYLSDDELLDTEGGFTGWDDETGTGAKMCIRDSFKALDAGVELETATSWTELRKRI